MVKVGRLLDRIGAVAVKNTVYVLPRTDDAQEHGQWIVKEVVQEGGEAAVFEAKFVEGLKDAEVKRLFREARDQDCHALMKQARETQSTRSLPEEAKKRQAKKEAEVRRLRRRLDEAENTRFRVISTVEERRLLEKTPSWLGQAIRVALLTGLRQGEILRLRRYDVDRERRLIHVSSETKNHHSRLVPYPAALEPLLEELLPDEGRPDQFVFARPDGEAFKRCHIVNGFRKAVRAAELHDCTFHDTRRTYASRLVNRGVSLPMIAKLLGHGATYVTERYAHVSEGALAAAVARLDVSRFPADAAPVAAQAE
jgi:integrase